MEENTQLALEFPSVKGKQVIADFDGGVVTSDAGLVFLRETERSVRIIDRLTKSITDSRRQSHTRHKMRELLTQRVMQIACGYEDADDSDTLRRDPALKIACGRAPISGEDLGSQPTMSRLENSVSRTTLYRIAQSFVDGFIASYKRAPKKIILDIDDTDDPTHGTQQMSLFNAHYDEHCYLPLHIYEGYSGKLIVSVLRPGRRPKGQEVVAIVRRVIEQIRHCWPKVRIVIRGDSHFSSPELFDMCASMRKVHFVVGLSKNPKLAWLVEDAVLKVEQAYKQVGRKVKIFVEFPYQAKSWSAAQRVVCKIEVSEQGKNVRFIVTDMHGKGPERMYNENYCARGRMENFIKNHKTYLHSDRTSCHEFEANQVRLFLHSAAYVLLHALDEKGLRNTSLAGSQFDTIILKVLKMGAQVIERLSQIRIHLPTSTPYKDLYERIHSNLVCFAT
jgi:hypothetical protein